MKITEDFLQKAASCGMAQNLLDALKIGGYDQEACSRMDGEACLNGDDEDDRLA
jgi:hypothetical protein